MYRTNGALAHNIITSFPPETNVKPQTAWYDRQTSTWFVGAIAGDLWKQIDSAWAHDTYGNWIGAPPTLIQPFDLKILKSDGALASTFRQDFDLVHRIVSGQTFSISWLKKTLTAMDGVADGSSSIVTIINTMTGVEVYNYISHAIPITNISLPNGSYIIRITYSDVIEGLRIPPGEDDLDPDYQYTTQDGRLSYYNPYQNWGEVPLSPNHPLRLIRADLIRNNTQEDVEEYAVYLTAEGPRDSQAAQIKLRIGTGAWEYNDTLLLTPARPLFRVGVGGASTARPFDPMASDISFQKKLSDGRLLLGGSRSGANGTLPAIWQWNPVTGKGTILAVAENACDPICEQLLSTGSVTGIVEMKDGNVIVLTLCSRHRLEESNSSPEKRLLRYPLDLNGEPGGRSLVALGDQLYHMTESFGKQPDPDTESFYNVGVDIRGSKLGYFPGTVAHVDNAMWIHRGKSYGVRSDGKLTDTETNLFVTYYDGTWNKQVAPLKSKWISLTRGISINGYNIVFGSKVSSEDGRVLRQYGDVEEILTLDFRLRTLSSTDDIQTGQLIGVGCGRQVVGVSISDTWNVISFTGLKVGESFPPEFDTDPPDDTDDVYYRCMRLPAAESKPVYVLQTHDCSSGGLLRQKSLIDGDNPYVRIRVDSTAPIDDYPSYNIRCRLNEPIIFRVPAYSKVELIAFWNKEDGNLDLPILTRRV